MNLGLFFNHILIVEQKNLLDDFANALINFDHIVVLDIYAAREKNIYEINSKDLVHKISALGKDVNIYQILMNVLLM